MIKGSMVWRYTVRGALSPVGLLALQVDPVPEVPPEPTLAEMWINAIWADMLNGDPLGTSLLPPTTRNGYSR